MIRGHISQSDDLLLGCGKDLSSLGKGEEKKIGIKVTWTRCRDLAKEQKWQQAKRQHLGFDSRWPFFFWLTACRKLPRKCFIHIDLPCVCLFLVLAQKFVFFFADNVRRSRGYQGVHVKDEGRPFYHFIQRYCVVLLWTLHVLSAQCVHTSMWNTNTLMRLEAK